MRGRTRSRRRRCIIRLRNRGDVVVFVDGCGDCILYRKGVWWLWRGDIPGFLHFLFLLLAFGRRSFFCYMM